MKIKEVEQRMGIPKATIRYYEDEGLIQPARNNENNYREYSEDDIKQLEHIKVLRVLGVPITDIKELKAGEITLDEVMNRRLESIREEEQSLEEVKRVCGEIIRKGIDYDAVDEQVLGEDKVVWREQIERILREDITKEFLTPEQLNTNIAFMLGWGYFLCAVFALIFGNLFWSHQNTEWSGTGPITLGRHLLEEMPGDVSTWFLASIIVGFICYITMYLTANVKAYIVIFHVAVVILNPLLASVYVIGLSIFEKKGMISNLHLAAFWTLISLYVICLYVLSKVKKDLFEKAAYVLSFSTGYTAVMTAIAWVLCKMLFVPLIAFFVFTFYIGLNWFHVYGDRKDCNRYYAVLQSSRIMNITGTAFSTFGRTRAVFYR